MAATQAPPSITGKLLFRGGAMVAGGLTFGGAGALAAAGANSRDVQDAPDAFAGFHAAFSNDLGPLFNNFGPLGRGFSGAMSKLGAPSNTTNLDLQQVFGGK